MRHLTSCQGQEIATPSCEGVPRNDCNKSGFATSLRPRSRDSSKSDIDVSTEVCIRLHTVDDATNLVERLGADPRSLRALQHGDFGEWPHER